MRTKIPSTTQGGRGAPLLVRLAMAAALLLVTGLAVAADPAPWRALYAGSVGMDDVVVDLTFLGGDTAHARVLSVSRGLVLSGVGTVTDADVVEVDLTRGAGADSPSFDLLYLENATDGADEAPGPVAGHLSGRLDPTWADDGARLELTLTVSGTASAATLPRVAQYAYLRVTEGRIDSSSAWPRFVSAALRGVAGNLEADAHDQVSTFVSEGRASVDDGSLGWGWTSDDHVDLIGAAGSYLSLLTSSATYTGGAHPNSYYSSVLLEVGQGGATAVGLADLFDAHADWEPTVTAWLTVDLLRQGAEWIEGGATVELEDLGTFTLGPSGLTFVFDPYAVGPYVQGEFSTTIPFGLLAPLARAGGALEAFAAAAPPTMW